MPKLTLISGEKMLKLLALCDFEIVRIKGSHHFLKNKTKRSMTVVPVHGNEELGVGLLISILSDVDLSRKEYEKLRRKI
ncbi:MAG: type II toxin-antitoxin system HicA family toxin [Patescibacteria group bacterium]|nr:type II toxin-antitoxin system HicA family toxin [Patescibacteria group bacterium]